MNGTQPPPVPAAQNSGLAIWSLVLGIVGIVLCFGPLAGIPAIICGHIAHGRVRSSGGALKGGGMAIAGFVLGYISLVWVFVIGMMAAIAIPNFVKARETAMKNACINNLRQIDGATEQWGLENKKLVGEMPTKEQLTAYIKAGWPACPKGGTYTINGVGKHPTCDQPGHAME